MAETQNGIDIPKGIDTPIELEKIGVKIVEGGDIIFKGILHKWRKISMNGKKLDVPLFEKPGLPPLAERIIAFHKKMIHGSCREQLGILSKTCTVEPGYDPNSGKFIGLDDKKIVTAKDFSDFVGIQIIWSDTDYLEMRKLLAGNVDKKDDKKNEKKNKIIYPDDKTMIADVVDWWNSLPTDPLYAASGKQDTLAKLAQLGQDTFNQLKITLGIKDKTPQRVLTATRNKIPPK